MALISLVSAIRDEMPWDGPCDSVRTVGSDVAPPPRGNVAGAWEFAEVTVRMALTISCVAVAVLGSAALYAHRAAAPACDSDQVQGEVFRVLRDQFHLEGVFLHDFRTMSGGFFSDSRDCVAEVAEIKGNVNAADMRWRQVHYRIGRPASSETFAVTVDLGAAVPFVPPSKQTLWARLLAHF